MGHTDMLNLTPDERGGTATRKWTWQHPQPALSIPSTNEAVSPPTPAPVPCPTRGARHEIGGPTRRLIK